MKSMLKDKNFMLIMSGKFISLFGSAVYQIGLIWYALSKYGKESGGILAAIMILGILPSVVFGGVIGSIIDRFNKKWIMVTSDIFSGIVVLGITLLMYFDNMSVYWLLVATAMLSVTESFVAISVNALIPELYDEERLFSANSINQFVERVTLLIGYSIGGAMIGFMGVNQVFLVNAISFFLCALAELFIVYEWKRIHRIEEKRSSMLGDFREVFYFVRDNTNILMITILFSLINLLWDPLFGIVFPYALKNDFAITSGQFGIIEAAFPAGFCLGAAYFSGRPKLLKGRDILFNSVLGANILMAFMALPLITGFKGNGWALACYIVALILVLGIFSSAINISASVATQTLVPGGLRGKYYGFSRSISRGLIPIGSAVIGALIGKVKPSVFFIASILLVFLVIFLVPKRSYRISRNEGKETEYQRA